MFKQFISIIPGADFYMITSLLIFFVFFVIVGVYLIGMKREYVNKMEHLPLDN